MFCLYWLEIQEGRDFGVIVTVVCVCGLVVFALLLDIHIVDVQLSFPKGSFTPVAVRGVVLQCPTALRSNVVHHIQCERT